ncbi:MAG: hypothetical protein CME71_09255 [Halobacteriovorax sp.]|nr:hypothetical protein [Halobacteriovorax sp.]
MQQYNVVILTTYELSLSLIFCMLTIYLATVFMNKFVLSAPVEWFIKERHKSGCLVSGALILSVLFLVQGSIEHSTSALQSLLMSNNQFSLKILGIALIYFSVFYIITFLASFVLMFIISKIYRKMMAPIDFDYEIEKKDNFGLSMFLTIIIISIMIFIQAPLNHFLGSLVFHNYLDKF